MRAIKGPAGAVVGRFAPDHRRQLLGRHGVGVDEALGIVAAGRLQQGQLDFTFHPFRHHLQAQLVGHDDDGFA
ncbi:hypothetical protein MJ904_23200 [Massilia sp. MB5]|uniref:hypothetical protein n=1 Tax=Massilia sp. MB5 TaxID=2919578 RepID=UPI001F103473|nr:hypothetical protein [Massilia sp. MB5]UMR29905.1 hypothetical protein MJ904_23200 [Massilia sp. MB5]